MFGSVAKEFALPKEARDPFRVYIACSGKIGYLIKLYRRVIKIARRAGVKKVSLDMLDRAWRRTEFDPSRLDDSLQPFSRSFAAVPDKATIEHIVQSGVETGPKQDVGGRSKRAKRADVRNALAA